MAQLFTLTPDILQIGADAFDSLIHELGKTCRLFYPPRFIPCTNCVGDAIGNKSPVSNISGGPINFPFSPVCPLCSGKGTLQTEVYEDVLLLLEWNPKQFDDMFKMELRVPGGALQAKGHIEIMPKVARANYMVADISLSAYANYRFVLKAEPVSTGNIIKGRYFTSLWERSPA